MNGRAHRVVQATPANVDAAARVLAGGELVAFPTETVYGLGADASNPDAVARIFAAKGRPPDHPLIVHLPSTTSLAEWARAIPPEAAALAEAFWPGPLTLILPRTQAAHDSVTGGQDSVGLRVPAHATARALLEAFAKLGGRGIAAPSANRYGHVSPTTAHHVAVDLPDLAMILDGGPCALGIESTIVAFPRGEPVLLRPGGVGLDDLVRVLGKPPRMAGADAPRASGTLASHYATRTPAFLVAPRAMASELAQRQARDERAAVLARTVTPPSDFEGRWLRAPQEPGAYAHDLYASLRALDANGADAILIEAVPDAPAWHAVRDRLIRATSDPSDDSD